MSSRAAIVAEAMSWLGTDYHDHGMLKGVGVDCAMLPLCVYREVGLLPADLEPPAYSSQSMLHEDREHYLGFVRQWAREIERDQVGPGDFAIWRFGRSYSHGGIVIDPPQIIHAAIQGRCVMLGDMDRDEQLLSRPVKFFTLF